MARAAPTAGRGMTRERVAATLRAEILDGRLAPGVQLRTESVTVRLGVSNSPLREAFVQLQAEGLVEVTPNRGNPPGLARCLAPCAALSRLHRRGPQTRRRRSGSGL